MASVTIYNSSTGRVLKVVKCPTEMVELQRLRPGEAKLVGVEAIAETQYIVSGRPAARPANPTRRANELLLDIPAGSVVRDDRGTRIPIVGTTATVDPAPGMRIVRVSSPWPMQEACFEFVS